MATKAAPPTADEVIALLGLRPLEWEGGYYAETFRGDPLPAGWREDAAGERHWKSAIYYLMTPEGFSALHRLPEPELFHFYLGDPVEQLLLLPDGSGRIVRLGHDLMGGERPQGLVPAGVWQGSRLAPGGGQRLGYALLGTTMAPGFASDFYEHGDRTVLMAAYPAFAAEIRALTREEPGAEGADG